MVVCTVTFTSFGQFQRFLLIIPKTLLAYLEIDTNPQKLILRILFRPLEMVMTLLGESRMKNTPTKEQMEKSTFLSRLLHKYSKQFCESRTFTELEPPGCTTERNEQLHRLLNRLMITDRSH